MQSRCYKVEKLNGLHARPAAELVKIARAHGCRLFVKIEGNWQEAGMVKFLTLGMGEGTTLEMGVEGGAQKSMEEACLAEMEKALKNP